MRPPAGHSTSARRYSAWGGLALHKLGDEYMAYSGTQLTKMAREGLIIEVKCREQNS